MTPGAQNNKNRIDRNGSSIISRSFQFRQSLCRPHTGTHGQTKSVRRGWLPDRTSTAPTSQGFPFGSMGAPVTTGMVAAEHPTTGPTERESVDCGVLPSTAPVLPMVQLERSRPSTPFTSELGTVGNLVSYFLGELAHGGCLR